jgi:hypothetical protein
MSDAGGFAPPPPPPPSGGGGDLPIAPKDPATIIASAFGLLLRYWKDLLVLSAIFVVGMIILGWLLVLLVTTVFTSSAASSAVGLLGNVAFILFASILTGAITRLIAMEVAGNSATVRDSINWATEHLGQIVVVSLLIALVIFVIGLVGTILDDITNVPIFGTLASLAALAASVLLSMAIPCLVVQGIRGADALGRSVDLVKPFFWHAVGTVVLAYLIVIGALIVSGIFALGGPLLLVVALFVTFLAILPFYSLVIVLLYVNLRVKGGGMTQQRLREELARNA